MDRLLLRCPTGGATNFPTGADSSDKGLKYDFQGIAILMDLSKAFDCLNHELLIAKLSAYGFSRPALKLIYTYLHETAEGKGQWLIQHLETDLSRCSPRFSFGTPAF